MATATLSSKGRIIVPAAVREALGVDAGDRVEFVEIAPGRYEFIAATRSVKSLKDMFGKPRKSMAIQELNAAIVRRGASARCERTVTFDRGAVTGCGMTLLR